MTHALAADFGAGNFYAALFADDALIAYALILTAMALPVLHRAEYSFAEKAVAFGLLRSVVYGFGFGYFAFGKFPYFFGGSNAYFNRAKIV